MITVDPPPAGVSIRQALAGLLQAEADSIARIASKAGMIDKPLIAPAP